MSDRDRSITAEIQMAADNIADMSSIASDIARAADTLANHIMTGSKVLVCGNGGSAADASHLVGELVGRLSRERPGIAAIALNMDPAVTTSLANDYGYEQGLARQVQALGNPQDILVAISTSGSSANVVMASQTARSIEMTVIALTGPVPSDMEQLADVVVAVPGVDTQRIQEAHGVAIHILCRCIEDALYPVK